jgi:predicted RNA-binding Zn-ribbon protein involved in translation (DUF1610 family)
MQVSWRSLLTTLLILSLLGTVGGRWLLNSLAIFVVVLAIAPVIGLWGVRWWVQRRIVTSQCPTCGTTFSGDRQGQMQCPSCGEVLEVHNNRFVRPAPPGVIDVDVQVID